MPADRERTPSRRPGRIGAALQFAGEEGYQNTVVGAFGDLGVLDEAGLRELKNQVEHTVELLRERLSEIEENASRRAELDYDYYKETWRDEIHEREHGLFSDVDE